MIHKKFRSLFLSFPLLLLAMEVFSQSQSTVLKMLIVESIYQIKIINFEKPLAMPSKLESKTGYLNCELDSPEETVFAYFDAMRSADVKRSNLCWTQESLLQLQARDRDSKRDEEYWRQRWLRTYATGFELVALKRAEYGAFTIVQVQIKDSLGKTVKDDFALERIGKYWKLTQKLAADPVLQYWDSEKTRVQVAPQSWMPLSK
jgi:hypothetical protein